MSIPILTIVLLGSLAAGVAATLVTRRLSESAQPPYGLMTGASVAMGGWAMLVFPTVFLLAISCALAWTLLVLAATDALAFRLPDILTLPLLAAGLIVSWWLPDHDLEGHAIAAILGIAAFYAIAFFYRRARGQDGLGMGDVKLAGAAGAWVGWQALPYVVLVACAVGFIWVGVGFMRRGKAVAQERIAFGVPLCFAIWITWLYGPPALFAG